MVARCKQDVTTLLERHNAAWDKCNAAWALTPGNAPQRSVDKLSDAHSDLCQTAPASMAEFFAKWRQIARFDIRRAFRWGRAAE